MTKRFLGLLLSVVLMANSSTSVIAMEGRTSDMAPGSVSELTTVGFEEPEGRSFEGAPEETDTAPEDLSLLLKSEDSDSSDSSGEDLTDEVPINDYIDDDALSEEDTSEDADAGDPNSNEDPFIPDVSSESDPPVTDILPEDYYDTFPTGFIDSDPGYEVESVTDGSFRLMRSAGSAYESAYTTPLLPPLRDQSPYGACWAFATDALAEINLMKKGLMSSADLSELHLAYFTYHWVQDPLDNFGSFTQPSSIKGVLEWGGNSDFGLNTYARWSGVSDESIANYKEKGSVANNSGLDESIAYKDVAHVENYFIEPIDISNLDPVKRLIVEHGAVSVSYYAVNSTSGATSANYYNKTNNAYYNPSERSQNHAVTIVGWDDNFSRDNFTQTPPGDGAWLIRNSWHSGNSSTENYTGYFWMSYYEATLGQNAYAGDFVLSDNYDNNYQYDSSLSPTVIGVSKAANIFTSKADSDIEVLKAVSFYTSSSNVDYEIKVFTDLKDPSDPESGLLCASTYGSTTYAGFYTIDLGRDVYLNHGETFSVIVESADGREFMIGKERHVSVRSNVYKYSSVAGQSFFAYDSNDDWMDNTNQGNMCIKAFTDNADSTGEIIPNAIIFSNVTDNKLTIGLGESFKTVVSVVPSNATNKKILWTSSDESVVTVDNGRLEGKSTGTATVTATCESGGASSTIEVTVEPKLLSLYIAAATATGSIVQGENVYLTAVPTPSDYSLKEDFSWSFSDEDMVDIIAIDGDHDRKLECIITKPGLLKVTCQAEGVKYTRNIYCAPAPEYFSYEVDEDNVITFSFDAVNGATSYEVTRDEQELVIVEDNGSSSYTCTVDEFRGKGFGSVTYTIRTYIGYYIVLTRVTVKSPYMVRYHLNGATNNPDNPVRYYPGSLYILYPPTVPDYHEFEGWFTDEAYTKEIKEITSDMTGDIDLYAKVKSYYSTGITISSEKDQLCAGQMLDLYVTVLPQSFDQIFDLDSRVVPSDAATVIRDGSKITIKALKTGTVSVTVTNNAGMRASKTVHIVDIYPESLSLSTDHDEDEKGVSTCRSGETVRFSAVVLPEDAADRKVIWEISDPDVLSLANKTDYSAEVLAKKSGTAYIYAVSNADSAIRYGHRIVVSDDGSYEVEGAAELRLIDTQKNPKLYASSLSSPTTTRYGEVAGSSSINTDISNPADDGPFYDLRVSVGKSMSLKADFLPKVNKSTASKEIYADPEVSKNISWTSGNTAIATISGGKITGKSAGTTVITATSEENHLVASCRVTVYEPVTAINLDKTFVRIGTNKSGTLSIMSVQPATSSDEFSFEVNRPDLVELVQSNNDSVLFRTLGRTGTAVITVTASESKKSAKCTVNIGTPVSSMLLSGKGGATSVAIGKSLQLVTSFNAGGKAPANKEVRYEIIKGSEFALLTEKGALTGLKEGDVTVRVFSTTDNVQATATFTVYSSIKSASLSAKNITIVPGRSATLKLNVTTFDTSCDYVTGSVPGRSVTDGEVTWSVSSNKIKLTNSGGSECSIETDALDLSPYTATVYASFRPYGSTKDTLLTCKIRVESAFISKIAVNPAKLTLSRGDIRELTAVLTPSAPFDSTVQWQIPAAYRDIICFSDENGVEKGSIVDTDLEQGEKVYVKAKNSSVTGTQKAEINVVALGESTGTGLKSCRVSVTVGNSANIAVIYSGKSVAENISVAEAKSVTLKAAVYSDNTLKNKAGSKKVIFKSLDESIAKVSQTGKVTGVRAGITKVYATIEGRKLNEKTDSFVTVNVYKPVKKLTLDKKKLSMSTAVDESSTRLSSYNQFSFLTADITPSSVYDNQGSAGKVTWTVTGTGELELTAADTRVLNSKDSVSEKQKYLSTLGYVRQNGISTAQGQSLAFKAVKPGTVKITATVLGKSSTCNVTIYSHVTGFSLKAPVYDKSGQTILEEADEEEYSYKAYLSRTGSNKTLTLKPLFDYQGAPYSDDKGTSAYSLYKYTEKYVLGSGATYISSDTRVANVSSKGVITAKSSGTCYITVSSVEGRIMKRILLSVGD